jgi:hypothetical protein
MSQPLDADLLDDLGEPEGPTMPLGADEGDAFGDALDADELDADGLEFEGADAMDELEDAVTEALDAEDADEFLGGLWKKIRSVAKKVAPIVSKVAPLLPIPGAGLIGKAADIVGKVAADDADEMDALDGMADMADDADELDAAAPIVAGLAIRKGMPAVHRLPHQQRKQLVKATTAATRHIVHQHGPGAITALPAIVHHARRIAVRQGLPAHHLPHLVRRTAAKVTQSPQLIRRFARASAGLRTAHPVGPAMRRSAYDPYAHRGARSGRHGHHRRYYGYGGYGGYGDTGSDRRITLRGPVRITVETV